MSKLTTLFSGSHGNSTLIQHGKTTLLVDAGFSVGAIKGALDGVGITPDDVDAILITHEHSDHVSALPRWTEHFGTPIFAHKKLQDCLTQKAPCGNFVFFDSAFEVGSLGVEFIPCSHDAVSCVSYRFFDGKKYTAICTDTGVMTRQMVNFLQQASTVVLESNYDEDMLSRGSYPVWLKQRIASKSGHLSNLQCASVVQQLLQGKVKNLVLGHLSQNNNTKEMAFAQALSVLQANNVKEGKDVRLFVADQYLRGATLD